MIYYKKAMHDQKAFNASESVKTDLSVTSSLCDRVLSLPIHPYLTHEDQDKVIQCVKDYMNR